MTNPALILAFLTNDSRAATPALWTPRDIAEALAGTGTAPTAVEICEICEDLAADRQLSRKVTARGVGFRVVAS